MVKVKTVKKKSVKKINWVEVIIVGLMVLAVGAGAYFLVKNVKTADYVVETNAFFAPFEFYEGQEIKGVDVEIVNRVAEKLGKTIAIKDVEFDVIIDNVEAGKIADAGVAGLTITEARKEKVDFSIPYYNSVQYAVYRGDSVNLLAGDYITWKDMAGKKIGSQTGGTGYLFAQDEIENGELFGKEVELKGYESHQLAADAVRSGIIDFAIVDELAARYIVSKNAELSMVPIYQPGENGEADAPTAEAYAVAVNKNHPELLEAFNELLTEILEKDENGESEMDRLVLKYMGF